MFEQTGADWLTRVSVLEMLLAAAVVAERQRREDDAVVLATLDDVITYLQIVRATPIGELDARSSSGRHSSAPLSVVSDGNRVEPRLVQRRS